MTPRADGYYFVHDVAGRVLAIVARATGQADEGTEIGVRPEPLPGQGVIEADLPEEYRDRELADLLTSHELLVDLRTGALVVRPHAGSERE